MTAAETVETSVTTINILLQDFTDLDDQPSQTLTDTPGFKPFILLRSLARHSEQHANNYIYYGSNVRCIRQQIWFNHRCKDLGLVLVGLRIRSPINTQKAIQIVNSTSRRLIRARINDCHKRLKHYKNKQPQRLDRLRQLIPPTASPLPTNVLTKQRQNTETNINENLNDYKTLKQVNDKNETINVSRTILPGS